MSTAPRRRVGDLTGPSRTRTASTTPTGWTTLSSATSSPAVATSGIDPQWWDVGRDRVDSPGLTSRRYCLDQGVHHRSLVSDVSGECGSMGEVSEVALR